MPPNRWVVVAVAVASCGRGRKAEPGPATAPPDAAMAVVRGDAWLHAPDPTRAQADLLARSRSLRCLLAGRDVLDDYTPDLTPALAAVITRVLVDDARDDGDGPTQAAWAKAIALHYAIDDRAGLRPAVAAFSQIDLPRNLISDQARALVGATLPEPNWYVDFAAIRDQAISGDVAGAAARYDRPATEAAPFTESTYVEGRAQALVALGRADRAQALVDAALPAVRVALRGAWLEVALMREVDVPAAVAALVAALDATPAGTTLHLDLGRLLRLARSHDQVAALAPLRVALRQRITAEARGWAEAVYADALAARDDATADQLARLVSPAWRTWLELLYRAPIADAIAAVRPKDIMARTQLARLWVRHAAEGGDPAIETQLAERACAGVPPPIVLSAPPAPPTAGAALSARDLHPRGLRACAGIEAELRLTIGGRPIATERFEGECSGACDAAAKRAGQDALDELQDRIDRGEASQGETDYNFTDCMWAGTRIGRRERVGDRDVVILVHHYIGEHDVDQDAYAIATEMCGALFISSSFGGTYGLDFPLAGLALTTAADGRQLVVSGANTEWRGVLLRVTLPAACPGEPLEAVTDSGG